MKIKCRKIIEKILIFFKDTEIILNNVEQFKENMFCNETIFYKHLLYKPNYILKKFILYDFVEFFMNFLRYLTN